MKNEQYFGAMCQRHFNDLNVKGFSNFLFFKNRNVLHYTCTVSFWSLSGYVLVDNSSFPGHLWGAFLIHFRTLIDFLCSCCLCCVETGAWEAIEPGKTPAGYRPGLLEDHTLVNYDIRLLLIGNGSDSLNRSEMQIWNFYPGMYNRRVKF